MKIICIGRNYAAHAKELKNEVPTEPVVFCKPDSALLQKGKPFFYPNFSKDVHHELELVIRIKRIGKHIAPKHALSYIGEVTLGIDFTARDLQQQLKQKGLPWEKAKGFDGSAPIGSFIPFKPLADKINFLTLSLSKNGKTVQQGSTADMLFPVAEIIAYVSTFYTLKIGDLIFTGTPQGVGPVEIGDNLEGFLEGEKLLSVPVR